MLPGSYQNLSGRLLVVAGGVAMATDGLQVKVAMGCDGVGRMLWVGRLLRAGIGCYGRVWASPPAISTHCLFH